MILPVTDTQLFSSMTFCHPWRAYQQRVLDDLGTHLTDRRLHIVAPPGAGKTILGLEIVRRLAQPALILVPSLTIREQWAERLRNDFLNEPVRPAWLSHDLRRPATITIATYQAFYQLLTSEPTLLGQLSLFRTLVADECHHLRREWWRVLRQYNDRHDPTLVALTATPPYDVNSIEWRRYHQFCGPIDAEISIPELVAAGDLCPHQDFIWPVLPTTEEQETLEAFVSQRAELLDFLADYRSLLFLLLDHPWLTVPDNHWEAIYAQPMAFTSLLVVLRYLGGEPPAATLGLLNDGSADLPPFSLDWLACFLEHAFFRDAYFATDAGQSAVAPLRQRLRRMGALDKKKINLHESPQAGPRLAASRAKLTAVTAVLALEWEQLGEGLRAVVLTDYIRPEFLPSSPHDLPDLNRLGAIPLFEHIRRSEVSLPPPVLLTGKMVIVPDQLLEALTDKAYAELAAEKLLRYQPLMHVPGFSTLATTGIGAKRLVRWITELFGEGHIRIIIGTKSLLGEGWDAPQINTLVLANTVGSYVLSNQMRGRAIRTCAAAPDKTANIWHLVTLNPAAAQGGHDVQRLQRRFRAFAGPSVGGRPLISNSLERFPQSLIDLGPDELSNYQANMRLYARARRGLSIRWQEALRYGDHLVEAIQPPALYRERKDGLSHYYHRSAGQHIDTFVRQTQRHITASLLLAVGLLTLALALNLTAPVLLIGMSVFLLIRLVVYPSPLGRLRSLLRHFQRTTALWRAIGTTLLVSTLLATVLLFWHLLYGLVFVLLWLGLSYSSLRPLMQQTAYRAWHRMTDMADTAGRLRRVAQALVATLVARQHLYGVHTDDLQIEETANRQPVCYLQRANHYQSQLFVDALGELLAPVANPRYLLALHINDQVDDCHYLPVPTVLGKQKDDAEQLRQELARHWPEDTFRLIYTRTPAGRQHLLKARLRFLDEGQAGQAGSERLWR